MDNKSLDNKSMHMRKSPRPGSTSLRFSGLAAAAVAALAVSLPAHVFAQVGSNIGSGWGGQSGTDIRDATITIVLNGKRDLTVTEIKQVVRDGLRQIPDARVNLLGDGGTSDVQTILTAEDGPLRERTAAQVERERRGLSTVADPRPSSPPSGPETKQSKEAGSEPRGAHTSA